MWLILVSGMISCRTFTGVEYGVGVHINPTVNTIVPVCAQGDYYISEILANRPRRCIRDVDWRGDDHLRGSKPWEMNHSGYEPFRTTPLRIHQKQRGGWKGANYVTIANGVVLGTTPTGPVSWAALCREGWVAWKRSARVGVISDSRSGSIARLSETVFNGSQWKRHCTPTGERGHCWRGSYHRIMEWGGAMVKWRGSGHESCPLQKWRRGGE